MKRIKPNDLFLVYLSYVTAILSMEFLFLLGFLSGRTMDTGIYVMGVILFGVFLYLFKKHHSYDCYESDSKGIHWVQLIGILLIFIIGLLKSVYPDTACDTRNYHLICQNPHFSNYFADHFAKGNFQVWGFRLGDRLFYLWRSVLGYRMGTLLNTLAMILIYLQIGKIFRVIGYKKYINELWALAVTLTQQALLMIGTYYVDILALPIGLEIVYIILTVSKRPQSSRDIVYFAFLNGLWFAFKMTNVVFVAPCVIIYIILVRKQLTIRVFAESFGAAFLPCSVYLIFTGYCTGNPVFPYFNNIFKSPYFLTEGFKDIRWGGQTLFEKLFWLFYLMFDPSYRQVEIPSACQFLLLVGVIGLVVCVINWRKKKEENGLLALLAVFAASTLAWSFSTGYSRYYIFGVIILGIFGFYLLNQFLKKNAGVAALFTGVALFQVFIITKTFFSGAEWTWTPWTKQSFKQECSKIFKDKDAPIENLPEIDMFYLSNREYGGIAELIDPAIYTYNAMYADLYFDDEATAEKYSQEALQKLTDKVYDIHPRRFDDIEKYVKAVNGYGMKIKDFSEVTTENGVFELIRLSHTESGKNVLYVSDEDITLAASQTLDKAQLSLIIGRLYAWEGSLPCQIRVSLAHGDRVETAATLPIDNSTIKQYTLDVGTVEAEDKVIISFSDINGNAMDPNEINRCFVINPEITSKG